MSKSPELTAKRRQILDFISTTSRERGYPPTVREIGAEVGLSSSSSVHFHLRWLVEHEYLERDGSLTRALRVTGSAADSPNTARTNYVPLVGQVAAGEPIFASQNIEQLIPTSPELFGEGEMFMLKVKGESMIEAGILDGDLVVVSSQPSAEDGEVVVALLDDEATVKYFHPHQDHVELRPANSAMSPIIADNVQIVGRVCGVIRSLR